MNGAKVVARAWTDPQYKDRLLEDGTAAIAELGFGGPEGEYIVVRREHTGGTQPRRLHAVLVLSVADAWAAAEVVQSAGLPRHARCVNRESCSPRWAP